MQRCLYAFAVRSLVAGTPAVDARLLYPRKKGALLKLDAPEATLAKLTVFLSAAYTAFAAGKRCQGRRRRGSQRPGLALPAVRRRAMWT